MKSLYVFLDTWEFTLDEGQDRLLLKAVEEVCDLVQMEKGAALLYDPDDLKNTFAELEGEDYLVGKKDLIIQYLYGAGAETVEEAPDFSQSGANPLYFRWFLENLAVEQQQQGGLMAALEINRAAQKDGMLPPDAAKVAVLFTPMSATDPQQPLLEKVPYFKDSYQSGDLALPVFIPLAQAQTIEGLWQWFSENRTPRIFHRNPKHGDAIHGGHVRRDEVSGLPISDEEAQALLQDAVGGDSNRLYNFDQTHQQFIRFEDENTPNNQYHGFLLDEKASRTVPKKVRIYLHRLLGKDVPKQ